jgi:hypothetical protein
MIAAVRDKFTPRLAILDERITTTNERIEATVLSTATMLRGEFAQKLSELSERIGTTDDTLKATMDTKAAPGLSELEARVCILELRPSVDLASNPPLPHENPPGNIIPPARPHDNHPAARPRVDTTFGPGVCFEPDGLSVEERARNAWAGSPSGRNAGAQVPGPCPQPPLETSQNPPQSATPPRNHPVPSHDTDPTPGGPIVSPRQGDREGQARQLGASRFDIVRLATPDYHIGTHGVAVLTHAILVMCGYNQIVSSDVVTCHNDIIAVHRRVRELWYNPSTHTYGMRDVFSPQVWRLLTTSPGLVQGIQTVRRLDRDSRDRATSCAGGGGFRDGGCGFRDGGGNGGFRNGGGNGGFRDDSGSPFLKDTHSGRLSNNSRTMPDWPRPWCGRGQLARPDHNQRPFLPDVQCAACKKVGHVAKHCNMLATAICLERYMKHDLSHSVRDAIEKDWLERWKERLGNPDGTPRQVMRAYVEDLNITVA